MKDLEPERRPLGDFTQHFWLLRSVSRVAGVDLGEAMREGRISVLDYASVVTRCRSAGCANACALWLANNGHTRGETPEFCANRPILEQLQAQIR